MCPGRLEWVENIYQVCVIKGFQRERKVVEVSSDARVAAWSRDSSSSCLGSLWEWQGRNG